VSDIAVEPLSRRIKESSVGLRVTEVLLSRVLNPGEPVKRGLFYRFPPHQQ